MNQITIFGNGGIAAIINGVPFDNASGNVALQADVEPIDNGDGTIRPGTVTYTILVNGVGVFVTTERPLRENDDDSVTYTWRDRVTA